MKDKIDERKIAEMGKYATTLKVVKADEDRKKVDTLTSTISATEESVGENSVKGVEKSLKSLSQNKGLNKMTQCQ